ncbi:MAG: uracil-DNA glycosylase [Planctomycetota bacterium]|nr:uracil-DNA glycosylase [Planctomycetota bacterium]MDA1261948.1 uracil-DNA glycosylase [Planctomycetota bacterium]
MTADFRSAQQLIHTDLLLGMVDIPRGRASAKLDVTSSTAVEFTAESFAIAKEVAATPSTPNQRAVLSSTTAAFVAVKQSDLAERGSLETGFRSEKVKRLAELRERHDRECEHCTNARGHIQTVFGEGNPDADIFFVGEAPGETEDQIGRPFVGVAGQKLDEMIRAMGLRREDCYIANVLKSRPPENRSPLPAEIERCGPYLVDQILIVNPKVIVTLGGPATQLLLKVDVGISKLRGVWAEWIPPNGIRRGSIPLMPTYHPAYLLRNYTVETRTEIWSDLKAVTRRVTQSSSE